MNPYSRTHTCGELRIEHEGDTVALTGWVHRVRNFGGLVFVDLRDRFGITQVLFDPHKSPLDVGDSVKNLRAEFVVRVEGVVVKRSSPNHTLPTGLVEILIQKLQVLSEAAVPPVPIADETMEVNEDLRLAYRYLDMRKGTILNNLVIRHKLMQATRNYLSKNDFIEVATPNLGRSTPEGARDYLVPSRVHPGSFYALPQSPQMYKQLLMVGGMDRYFQIASCFRDEDLRADRQPEFHQIDIEMSFATSEELFKIVEGLMERLFFEVKGVDLELPFKRMTYAECMDKYGCDKPDLRFGLELQTITQLAQKSTFSPFLEAIANDGVVKGLKIPGGSTFSRRQVDELNSYVQQFGFKGIAWLKHAEGGIASSLAKFMEPTLLQEVAAHVVLNPDELFVFLGGSERVVNQALDHLRRKVAKDLNLINQQQLSFLWVTDFPLFAWNAEEQKLESEHHPFTSPHRDDIHLVDKDPLRARSSSYDLVLNGYEIASGSERIFTSVLQEKIFSKLGLTPEMCKEQFGFFVEALTYGTPPHLGIALGFDRIAMIACGAESIRDVIAFPKNAKARDVMTDAPQAVLREQLDLLSIRVIEKNN